MFKNWPEICKLANVDRLLMHCLALLDLQSPLASRVAAAFPEYFSETEVRGPVPWSVLQQMGRDMADLPHPELGHEWMVDSGVFEKLNLPVLVFRTPRWHKNDGYEDAELFPEEHWYTKTGFVVNIHGRDAVVVQNDDSHTIAGIVYLVPAECIRLDL